MLWMEVGCSHEVVRLLFRKYTAPEAFDLCMLKFFAREAFELCIEIAGLLEKSLLAYF